MPDSPATDQSRQVSAREYARQYARRAVVVHSAIVVTVTIAWLFLPGRWDITFLLLILDFPISIGLYLVWCIPTFAGAGHSIFGSVLYQQLTFGLIFLLGGGWWFYVVAYWLALRTR